MVPVSQPRHNVRPVTVLRAAPKARDDTKTNGAEETLTVIRRGRTNLTQAQCGQPYVDQTYVKGYDDVQPS